MVNICSKRVLWLYLANHLILIKLKLCNLHQTLLVKQLVLSQYLNTTTPVIITGATTGLKARVIGIQDATSTTQPILILTIY